jgi:hypothetical protein
MGFQQYIAFTILVPGIHSMGPSQSNDCILTTLRSSVAASPEVPCYSIRIALTHNFKSTYSNCYLWHFS